MPKSTLSPGRAGEEAALQILQMRGYKILDRNFRSRYGEIDIVAQDGNILVFVEVKTRWSRKYGYPEEAVTPRKLQSIIRTGEYYKVTHSDTPDLIRVDVVALEVDRGRVSKVRLIKNVTQ